MSNYIEKFKLKLSPKLYPFLFDKKLIIHLVGGRGSGKTEAVVRKLFFRDNSSLLPHRHLVVRKYGPQLAISVIEAITRYMDQMGIDYVLTKDKSDRRITYHNDFGVKQEYFFRSIDDPGKLKSTTGVTDVWVEEATQLTRADVRELILLVREYTSPYPQIILSYNPDETEGYWIKKDFYDNAESQDYPFSIYKTIWSDNPIQSVREFYGKILEGIQDEAAREIYLNGNWASVKGLLYKNFKTIYKDDYPIDPDLIFYGLDPGFTAPAALMKVECVEREADNDVWIGGRKYDIYVSEVFYETGLDNAEIAAKIKKVIPIEHHKLPIIVDNAEPKLIRTMQRAGLSGTRPCRKGDEGGSMSRVKLLNSLDVYTCHENINLEHELRTCSYKYDRKNDRYLDERSDNNIFDHCLDAIEYVVFTMLRDTVKDPKLLFAGGTTMKDTFGKGNKRSSKAKGKIIEKKTSVFMQKGGE